MKLNCKNLVTYGLSSLLMILLLSITITGCKSDESPEDDRLVHVTANAVGEQISCYDIHTIDTSTTNLWINDYAILYIGYDFEKEIPKYLLSEKSVAYHEITESTINEIAEEISKIGWIGDSVQAAVKESCVNYINSIKSQYHYIARWSDSILIFNRTSDINYLQ